MYGNTSDIVRVSLEHVHALECIIVEYADLHVVRARDDPIFAGHEFTRPHWWLADLKRFH